MVPDKKGRANARKKTAPSVMYSTILIHVGQPRSAAFHKSLCLKSFVRPFISSTVGNHTTNKPGKTTAGARCASDALPPKLSA